MEETAKIQPTSKTKNNLNKEPNFQEIYYSVKNQGKPYREFLMAELDKRLRILEERTRRLEELIEKLIEIGNRQISLAPLKDEIKPVVIPRIVHKEEEISNYNYNYKQNRNQTLMNPVVNNNNNVRKLVIRRPAPVLTVPKQYILPRPVYVEKPNLPEKVEKKSLWERFKKAVKSFFVEETPKPKIQIQETNHINHDYDKYVAYNKYESYRNNISFKQTAMPVDTYKSNADEQKRSKELKSNIGDLFDKSV